MGKYHYGTELVRRIASGKAYALTCPITKADGTKFENLKVEIFG
jgi:tyrosyl-tRNA synthetase